MRRNPLQLALPLDASDETVDDEREVLERYVQWIERIWDDERPLTAAERAYAAQIARWALPRGYWNLNMDAELLAEDRLHWKRTHEH